MNWTLFEPRGALSVASMIGDGRHVEPAGSLGSKLALPGWLEGERSSLERTLSPV